QHLSEDDQVRFGERFGPPAVSHTRRFTTGNLAVMLISNVRQYGKLIGALPDGEMNFHSDQCHQERPAMASMLYALEVPAEGGNLLDRLFDHQEQREFNYEHVWRPHDLVMWDNRCALHARTDFSAAERRLLRRLTILGEKPV